MTDSFEQRLADLGIVRPEPPSPIANSVLAVRDGNLLFLSGQGPLDDSGRWHTGKLGATCRSTKVMRMRGSPD